MAKDDNLKDFLTDVADAIREKKGTTDLINPQDFSAEIASIKGEKRYPVYPFADVQFIDYDGVLLHSYTWDEAMALEELPPLPSHDGLICQGWNYTLDELKLQNEKCDIGANYITDDGATRFHLCVDDLTRSNIDIQIKQSVANGVEFNWGDGSSIETFASTSNIVVSHNYTTKGNYIVSIKVKNGTLTIGKGSTSTSERNMFVLSGAINWVTEVNIGDRVTFNQKAFAEIRINAISIPLDYTFNPHQFNSILNTKAFIFPRGVSSLPERCFEHSKISEAIISIPHSATTGESYSFYLTSNCTRICLPSNLGNANYGFLGGHKYYNITTPTPLKLIHSDTFISQFMVNFKALGDITNIGSGAFKNCYMLKKIDLTNCTSVPVAAGPVFNTLTAADVQILVPKALEEEWKNATNWVDCADKIVGV